MNSTLEAEQKPTVKALRVAHIVLSLDVGGLEVLVCQMAEKMRNYNCDPIIICLDHPGTLAEELTAVGIQVFNIQRKAGFIDVKTCLRLIKLLRSENIELVHSHNQESHFYVAIASQFSGVKRVIHTQHGVEPPYDWKKYLKLRLTGHFIDRFVGVSQDINNLAIKKRWIPKTKVTRILNGVNTDQFKPDQDQRRITRQQLKIEDNEKVLICVARLSPIKNHKLLITSFSNILKEFSNCKLLIVGGGPEEKNIRESIAHHSLNNNVRMLGESRNISQLLQASDCFVLTSISEGINVSLLEAMACGLAPIVTDVGGNNEVIQDHLNGQLVPLGNSEEFSKQVVKLLADPQKRKEISKHAREQVLNNFSLNTMLTTYMKYYKN